MKIGKELVVVERLPIKKEFNSLIKKKQPLKKRQRKFEKGMYLDYYA